MTNTNTNNANANARDAYIERARETAMDLAGDWFNDCMTEKARRLVDDDGAEVQYTLCPPVFDGACIEARAWINRREKGWPLEFYGVARHAWETLTGVQRRALGKLLEHGGKLECWTEHDGDTFYYNAHTTDVHCAWECYNAADVFRYNTDDVRGLPGGDTTRDAVMDFEHAVHDAIRDAGLALETYGLSVIAEAEARAAEYAAEEWDAEHAEAA